VPLLQYTEGAQVWITQFYLRITPYLPLPRKRSANGATTDCGEWHLIRPRKNERLSQPSWLTYSEHEWSPAAVGQVQDRERLPVGDWHSTTVPDNQPVHT